MLLILTGNIQTGKTRWLQALTRDLQQRGVHCCGVVAPGIWHDHGPDHEPRFEKLGIENLLLPQGETVPFARRRDLTQADGIEDAHSQSARAQLGWDISDAALAQVNDHFLQLREAAGAPDAPGLLIVDELGRLELMRGEGLTEAVGMLEDGPGPQARHALIVVRQGLVDLALQMASARFGAWGAAEAVSPTEETASRILDLFQA